jgi:DNA-binding transcriptional MerR regulator
MYSLSDCCCQQFVQDKYLTDGASRDRLGATFMDNAFRYSIGAVARLTGLSLDTLRAWERRYGVVRPGRGPRGRRYSEAQVTRLRRLAALVERGHAISEVARLDDRQLADVLGRSAGSLRAAEDEPAPTPAPDLIRPIVEALDRFDHALAERELSRAAALVPARALVHDVVLPLMREVGDRWHRGDLTVAQEHLASGLVRGLLAGLLRAQVTSADTPTVLLATPAGELHELGLLAAAMLAAGGGLNVVYLGPNLPAQEIVAAAERVQARAVLVSVTSGLASVMREVGRVAGELPADIELWVGAVERGRLGRIARRRVVPVADFIELEQQLRRLGARL